MTRVRGGSGAVSPGKRLYRESGRIFSISNWNVPLEDPEAGGPTGARGE